MEKYGRYPKLMGHTSQLIQLHGHKVLPVPVLTLFYRPNFLPSHLDQLASNGLYFLIYWFGFCHSLFCLFSELHKQMATEHFNFEFLAQCTYCTCSSSYTVQNMYVCKRIVERKIRRKRRCTPILLPAIFQRAILQRAKKHCCKKCHTLLSSFN